MNVLLVSTYELGRQPLGVASPAALLHEAGAEVEALDLAVEPFAAAKVRRADVVGISVPMHTAIRLGVRVAERVRRVNPRCHLCFYGLYASLNASYLLRSCADSVVGGEFDAPLAALVDALARGAPLAALPGVQIDPEVAVEPFLGRQRFRTPKRDILPPLERYARLDTGAGEVRLVGAVEASRGCAHRCLHCPVTPVYGGRLRIVQRPAVLEDVAGLVAMGARHLTFADPDFLNGVKHSLQIARAVHEAFPEVSFDITTKVEHLLAHADLLPELRDLGCAFVLSAVESLSDAVLANLAKGHSRADVVAALELTASAGVPLRPSLVSFTPWTTLDDFIEVLDFVDAYGLVHHVDPVQYSIRLLVPPGSSLLGTPQMDPHLGDLAEDGFSYAWRHPDPRMDRLHAEVGGLVARAAERHQDAAETFHAVRELAYARAGRARPERAPAPSGPRPPRLTESWFCCAEPTDRQFVPIAARSAGTPF